MHICTCIPMYMYKTISNWSYNQNNTVVHVWEYIIEGIGSDLVKTIVKT